MSKEKGRDFFVRGIYSNEKSSFLGNRKYDADSFEDAVDMAEKDGLFMLMGAEFLEKISHPCDLYKLIEKIN